MTNDYFTSHPILDLDSLKNRSLPQDFLVANYNGVLSNNFFVEAQYSRRHFTFQNDGSLYTNLVKGTVLIDVENGGYYNSPYFCGVCSDERRNNEDFFVKGTWFLSTPSIGSHNIVFGCDNFAGKELLNNYQSGSNYVIGSTSAIFRNGDIFPVFDSSSYLIYFPITEQSTGNQRHRVRAFVEVGLPLPERFGNPSIGLVQAYDTGVSHSAAGLAIVSPYVTNPGYVTPPRTSTYYFSPRGAFRTDNISRTDISLNYSIRIANAVELFLHPQVFNLFNRQGVIAVDTMVLSAANAAGFTRFSPFTTQPVQGVNWSYGPNFGKARNAADYQTPRFFQMSMGLRF